MNLIIVLSLIAFSSGAQLNRGYLPPDHAHSSGGSEFLQTPIVVEDEAVDHKSIAELNKANIHQPENEEYVQIGNNGHKLVQNSEAHHVVQEVNHDQHFHVTQQTPERSQAALERHAAILRQAFENNVESYAYVYETENGIFGEENGVASDGVKAHGAFSYIGDDGKKYSITYTADENGFRPQGDHLPTPHPIPAEILKSLKDNARDEAAGIYDDGSYNEEKYGGKVENSKHKHSHVIINEQQPAVSEADAIITDTAVLPEPVIPQAEIIETNDLHTIATIPEPVVPTHVHNLYLPPTNYQFVPQFNIPGQFINGVPNTYLPPIHQQIIENSVSQTENADQATENNEARKTILVPVNNQINGNNGVKKTYLPPVRHQATENKNSQGVSGQGIVNNGGRKIYLPPKQRQAVQTSAPKDDSKQVFSNNVARKTYLPPFKRQQINDQANVRTYLPPKEDRSSQNGQFVFGARSHQASFDSKSGYQY